MGLRASGSPANPLPAYQRSNSLAVSIRPLTPCRLQQVAQDPPPSGLRIAVETAAGRPAPELGRSCGINLCAPRPAVAAAVAGAGAEACAARPLSQLWRRRQRRC